MGDGPGPRTPVPMWAIWKKLLIPGFQLGQLYLRSELVDGRCLSLNILCLPNNKS